MRLLLFYLFISVCFCGSAQQLETVDFKKITAKILFAPKEKKLFVTEDISFKILKNVEKVYLDARNFNDTNLSTDHPNIGINYAENKIILQNTFRKDKEYNIKLTYEVSPKRALYFWGWDEENLTNLLPNHKQIWTQGQGKYTSNWLPSIDDMNDKIRFELSYTFDKDYTVISNGKLHATEENNDQTKTWHYVMDKPMSSYLVAFAIGKYTAKTTTSATGIKLENYIYPERASDFEATYRYHKDIFDYIQIETGVPYPWGDTYRQTPVRDFLYAGMENTGCTLFSDDFIVNSRSFEDLNFMNVSAHELAHQWSFYIMDGVFSSMM